MSMNFASGPRPRPLVALIGPHVAEGIGRVLLAVALGAPSLLCARFRRQRRQLVRSR